jgi:peptidase E
MSAILHLIGGGPGALLQTRRHIQSAVKQLGKKKPLVAYVGAASNDHAGFRHMLSAAFLGTGARLEPAHFAHQRAAVAKSKQLLEDCDLVFMSGGDVEHGMKVLDDRDASGLLKRLARAGKPFVGISAGSIMLCRHWVRFPGDDEARAELFDCLGIAPLHMDAHSEADNWSELRVLVRLLARADPRALGYGVPSRGCLRIDAAGELSALGDAIARVKSKNGAPVDDKPLALAGKV